MAAAYSARPLAGHPHHANIGAEGAVTAIQRALELLGRVSADWRNGDQGAEGALPSPVSVNLARRALREALKALEPPRGNVHCLCGRSHCPGACLDTVDVENDHAGISWYNNLSRAERLHWHEVADSAVPADAWRAFTSGRI